MLKAPFRSRNTTGLSTTLSEGSASPPFHWCVMIAGHVVWMVMENAELQPHHPRLVDGRRSRWKPVGASSVSSRVTDRWLVRYVTHDITKKVIYLSMMRACRLYYNVSPERTSGMSFAVLVARTRLSLTTSCAGGREAPLGALYDRRAEQRGAGMACRASERLSQ